MVAGDIHSVDAKAGSGEERGEQANLGEQEGGADQPAQQWSTPTFCGRHRLPAGSVLTAPRRGLQRYPGRDVKSTAHARSVHQAGGDDADLCLARAGVVEHRACGRALFEVLGHREEDVSKDVRPGRRSAQYGTD